MLGWLQDEFSKFSESMSENRQVFQDNCEKDRQDFSVSYKKSRQVCSVGGESSKVDKLVVDWSAQNMQVFRSTEVGRVFGIG